MPAHRHSGFYCAVLVVGAFALCVLVALKAPNKDIWVIHVVNEPTPPAEGRLPSYYNEGLAAQQQLVAEIAGIAGSYVVCVIIVCTLLLTIGRRLRRATQASPSTLAMEILKPTQMNASEHNPWGPSPISPNKTSVKWPSPNPQQPTTPGWAGSSKHSYHESVRSVATFDESVISDDRARNELEMDRLWGAVAEHESQRGPSYPQSLVSDPPRSPLAQNPPELQYLRHARNLSQQQQQYIPPPPPEPVSPTTTRYPSNLQGQAIEPPSRNSDKSPRRLHKPSPISTSSVVPSRTSSRSSFASWGRKKSPSVRDLTISPPMGSPDFRPDTQHPYDESEPLSPRFMQPGAPPSAPAHREAFGSVEIDQKGRRFHFAPSIRSSRSDYAGSPAQTPRTATFPISPPPVIREQPSREEAWVHEQQRRQRHQPPPPPQPQAPQQQQQRQQFGEPPNSPFRFTVDAPSERSNSPSISGKSSRSNKPKPLALGGASSPGGSSLRTAPLPFRALRSPLTQRPPSMIKATEIDRPAQSRFLQTPRTGVPATPYSPYMPMTPLTPMTPSRLVTREERRRAKKEEGRRVLTAEDVVPEEDDMWG